jgi:hypothetical protein
MSVQASHGHALQMNSQASSIQIQLGLEELQEQIR